MENTTINRLLDIFKSSPTLIVLALAIWLFTTTMAEKQDRTNELLLDIHVSLVELNKSFEAEAEDTLIFIKRIEEMNNKLDIAISN